MGIKKFFKIKPPEEVTPDVNREELNELGIPVKNVNRKKKEKFAAYGAFAKDKGKDKFFAPPGYENYAQPDEKEELEDLNKSEMDPAAEEDPYMSAPPKNDFDPYARNNFGNAGGSSNPYEKAAPYSASGSPYAQGGSDPYARQQNPYGASAGSSADPYATGPSYSSTPAPVVPNSSSYNQGPGDRGTPAYSGGSDAPNQHPYNPRQPRSRNPDPKPLTSTAQGNVPSGNPYGGSPYGSRASTNSPAHSNTAGNPYASAPSASLSRTTSRNPYGSMNAYNSNASNPYGSNSGTVSNNPYGSDEATSGSGRGNNPYSVLTGDMYGGSTEQGIPGTANATRGPIREASIKDTFDFEAPPQAAEPSSVAHEDDIDLNATIEDGGDDLNESIHEGYSGYGGRMQQEQLQQPHMDQAPEQSRGFQTFEDIQRENQMRQQQEEDEQVDEIKQEIRFTKQSSVASTRNTLKMAQEAESAGMNTLGMLGHQSEKLNNVERNLDLMKMQNRVAEDKVAELKKLNRNILAVHVSNPFNSKRRLREAEDRIKMQRMEDKMMQEQTNNQLQQSTQRIEGALMGNGNDSETVRQRYQNKAILEKAKRYQFENDQEDDEMEVEIDRNLDKIGQISSRLKRLAVATGSEIDAQQDRIKNIEEDTDNMDIKIHLNTTRLTQIR